MTDEKSKLVPPPPPEDNEPTDEEILEKVSMKAFLITAAATINQARRAGLPLIASYKAPCQCGVPGCQSMLSVQVTPYTEVYYDALRSIH